MCGPIILEYKHTYVFDKHVGAVFYELKPLDITDIMMFSETGSCEIRLGQVRCLTYALSACRRVNIATVLLQPPLARSPMQTPGQSCQYPSNKTPPDATMKMRSTSPTGDVYEN